MERRTANYELLKIFEKFQHGGEVDGTCGNLSMSLEPYDFATPNAYEQTFKGSTSAPMLLARLVSAGIPIEIHGQEGYKTTWQTILTHKASGNVVTFYDWKGGVSYGSNIREVKGANKTFIKDLRLLLKALSDSNFPHPYDGCAIGEEA